MESTNNILQIKEGTVVVTKKSLKGRTDWEQISIPDTVRIIEDEAFEFCIQLTQIILPHSVTRIGDYAFAYCESLQSITIPDSVTCIGHCAFVNCNSLQSISIPKSLKRRSSRWSLPTGCRIIVRE